MTTDGGAHWRDVSPPMLKRKGLALSNGLAGAAFLSPSDFFVSLYESSEPEGFRPVFLLHTTDSGRKWTEVGSFPEGVGTAWVSFQNDQQGWDAIGNGAAGGTFTVTIYETTNGGAHWVMVSRSMSLGGKPGTPDNSSGCGDTGLVAQGTLRAPVLWLTGYFASGPCVMESTDGGRRWATLVFLALPLLRAVKRGLRSFRQARTALLLPGTEQSTVRSQLSIRRRTAARPGSNTGRPQPIPRW